MDEIEMYCKKCGQDVGNGDDAYCPQCMIQIESSASNDDEIQEPDYNETVEEAFETDILGSDTDEIDYIEESIEESHEIEEFIREEDVMDPIVVPPPYPENSQQRFGHKGDMNKDYQEYKDNIFNKKEASQDVFYDYVEETDKIENGAKSKLLILLIILAFLVALGIAAKFLLIDTGKFDVEKFMQDIFPKKTEEPKEQPPQEDNEDTQEPPEVIPPEVPVEPAEDIHSREYLFRNLDQVNENILEIRDNSYLVRDTAKKYSFQDINDATLLENRLWKTVDAAELYYEETLVKALVRFNSKWNDYVNDNDPTVLSLAEKDSRAYNNIINFRRGNKKQEFLLFEIGEIRQGTQGFYVWTHEKIKQTENGKEIIKEYYWIYQLVEGTNDFLVSNYFMM